MTEADRWSRRKAKHRKDGNNGKGGLVAGNPRYSGKHHNPASDRRPHRNRRRRP